MYHSYKINNFNCGTVECHLSGHHLSEHVGHPTLGMIDNLTP